MRLRDRAFEKVMFVWSYVVSFLRLKKKVVRKPRKKRQYEQLEYQYNTIRGLLDDLDHVFKSLKKVRPKKHNMQRMIRRFGPYIFGSDWNENSRIDTNKLDGIEAYGLPSYVIGYWPKKRLVEVLDKCIGGKDEKKKAADDQFENVYFCATKSSSVGVLPRRPGYVYYEACLVLSDKVGSKYQKPMEAYFYVLVDKKTGVVQPLRTPITTQNVIPNKKHPSQPGIFHTTKWDYPNFSSFSDSDEKIKDWLRFRFVSSFNQVMTREYGINIIVKKGGYRATFCVPQDRWKYFFKERIKVKTRNGNTKPIYHSVTAHARQTKTKLTAVKTHYRGLRDFFWNGYHIRIVMQGKHGLAQASFGVTAKDKSEFEPDEKTIGIDSKKVSGILNDVYEGAAIQ